ncbi:reticulon-like protein B21 [Gossypium arboreum]|uniref:reticulon-like protein B21 n=1 Tax=Gossypium arboreum TaxID=29729 RepID=UPI0022F1A675|nr:reticulon-like protein B21 [Gossypium arboreum]
MRILLLLIAMYKMSLAAEIKPFSFTDQSSADVSNYVVGEEEAIWLLKLVLPYLNEFLLKLRALFSGDPSTTMKMAVLLFVLARCGSFITIWKMAKLGFFGVFIVPKLCTSYSHQLSAYGIMLLLETARSFEASLISVGVHGTFFSAMFLAKQTKVLILCSSNFKYLSQFANFRKSSYWVTPFAS